MQDKLEKHELLVYVQTYTYFTKLYGELSVSELGRSMFNTLLATRTIKEQKEARDLISAIEAAIDRERYKREKNNV